MEWREKGRGTAGRYVGTLRFRGGDGGVDKIARDVVWGMGMEGKGEGRSSGNSSYCILFHITFQKYMK